MARRLKVYETRLGFFDTVVAAPSQSAALAAWGVHQNLFAIGEARVAEDPSATKAALAEPGVPLMRAAGSDVPFSRKPSALALPAAPKPRIRTRRSASAAAPQPARKRPPDRTALSTAERRLEELAQAEAREKAELERRRRNLEDEARAAAHRWARARNDVEAELARARKAFVAEGGKP